MMRSHHRCRSVSSMFLSFTILIIHVVFELPKKNVLALTFLVDVYVFNLICQFKSFLICFLVVIWTWNSVFVFDEYLGYDIGMTRVKLVDISGYYKHRIYRCLFKYIVYRHGLTTDFTT